jgi:hypothetical protein
MAARAKRKKMNVFLSYSQRDERFARRIAEELAGFGFSIWDDTRIAAGANWALEIGKALEQSDAMVVLISPDYLASQWAQREIEYGLSTSKYKGRLIPVLVRPTSDVPWILSTFERIDATANPRDASRQIAKALWASAEVTKR